jgi:hypothetical protein
MKFRYGNFIRLLTTKNIKSETKEVKKCVNCEKCNNILKKIQDKPPKIIIDKSKFFIPGPEKGLPLPWQSEV